MQTITTSSIEGLTVVERLRRISRPVTARTLAEILGVSPITIYKQAAKGDIPSFRIATAVRFDGPAVAKWLEGGAR